MMDTMQMGDLHIQSPAKPMQASAMEVVFDMGGGFDVQIEGFGGDDGPGANMFGHEMPMMGDFHIMAPGKHVGKKHDKKDTNQPEANLEDLAVSFGDFHIIGAGTKLKEKNLPVTIDLFGGGDELEVSFGGGDDSGYAGRDFPAMGDFHIMAPGKHVGKKNAAKANAPSEAQINDLPISFGEFFIAGAGAAQTSKQMTVDVSGAMGGGGGLEVKIGGFGDDDDRPQIGMMTMPTLRISEPQKTMPALRRPSVGAKLGEDDEEGGDFDALQVSHPQTGMKRKASINNLDEVVVGEDDDMSTSTKKSKASKASKKSAASKDKSGYPTKGRKVTKKADASSDEEADEDDDASSEEESTPKKASKKKKPVDSDSESDSDDDDDEDSSDSEDERPKKGKKSVGQKIKSFFSK